MESGGVGYPFFRLGKRCSDEQGVSLLEFALGIPFIIVVVAGLIDVGFALRRSDVIANAARQGALTAAAVSGDAPVGAPFTCGALATQAVANTQNYLQAAGLDLTDWVVGPIQVAPNPPGPVFLDFVEDPGTSNEVTGKTITVSVEPSGTQRGCILCLTNYVAAIKPRAQSVFALETPCV